MMPPHRSSPPEGVAAALSAAAVAAQHQHQQQHREAQAAAPPSSGRKRGSSPPRRQPPHTPEELQFAKRTLQKLVQDSRFFPERDENNQVQTIRESELEFGSVIGKGGFCEVRKASIRGYRNRGGGGSPRYAMKYLSPTKTASSRVFQRGIADLAMEACFLSLLRHENIIGLHYVSEGSLDENYNCAPRPSRQQQQQDDEIVVDAHGNLQVRRRPPPSQPPPSSNSHLFGYFLLLDPLHETLTDRIDKTYVPQTIAQLQQSGGNAAPSNKMWDRIRHKSGGGSSSRDGGHELARRLGQICDVAAALKYLHEECHIIFRDIKPDNIGFYRSYRPQCTCGYHSQMDHGGHRQHECTCYDEVTKLFDFGLAKELKSKHRKTHPAYPDQRTYKLTGCTGSRRYMAPEVCFSDPYNEKADVYSFGMLLYQAASLVTPFDGFSMGRHEREVLRGGFRPDVRITKKSDRAEDGMTGEMSETDRNNYLLAFRTKRYWPKELPRLMEECWDYDMRYRPEMDEVTHRLKTIIDDMSSSSSSRGDARRGGGVANPMKRFTPSSGKEATVVTQETHTMSSHPSGRGPSHHPYTSPALSSGIPGAIGSSQHRYYDQHGHYGQTPATAAAASGGHRDHGRRSGDRRHENYHSDRRRRSNEYDDDGDAMMQYR